MSFREHQDFHPIIDELVFYVSESKHLAGFTTSFSQAVTLIKFGISYNITEVEFWSLAINQLEESIPEKTKVEEIDEVLEVVTIMKEHGVLTNKVLRSVASLIKNLKNMTTSQLTLFTQIYTSEEMQQVV